MRVGYTSEFLACSAPYSCSRFVLSSPLVASPFHIYNVYFSGVLGHLPSYPASAAFSTGFESAAGMRVLGERQTYVNANIAQLKKRMGDLGMLNLNNTPKDRSGYGSRVVVLDVARDVKVEYKLVSSEEVDAEKGLISTTSPIGRALLNRRVG